MNIYSTQKSLVVLHNNRRATINFEGTGTIPSTWKAQICKYSGDDAIKGRWDDIKQFKPEHTYKDKNIIIKIGMSSVYDENHSRNLCNKTMKLKFGESIKVQNKIGSGQFYRLQIKCNQEGIATEVLMASELDAIDIYGIMKAPDFFKNKKKKTILWVVGLDNVNPAYKKDLSKALLDNIPDNYCIVIVEDTMNPKVQKFR